MQQALRPYATAGIVITGAGLIAVSPVAAPLPALQHAQARSVHLTAGFEDVLSQATANAATLYNNFALAPFVGLQQEAVNAQGYVHDVINGTSTAKEAFEAFLADQQKVASAFSLSNNFGLDDKSFADVVSTVVKHTLNNQLDLDLANHAITAGHNLLLSQIGSFLPPDVDADQVTEILQLLSSPLSAMLMGSIGPFLSPIVALVNDLSDGNFADIPADMLGGFLNGADLSLDALIPLIQEADILPEGTTINSLDLALGGLLTPGEGIGAAGDQGVYHGVDAAGNAVDISPVGGSLFNSLGLNITVPEVLGLPGPFDIDVPSSAIGPIGAWETWQQTMGAVLGDGWDGKKATQDPPVDGFSLPAIAPGDGGGTAAFDALAGFLGLNDIF